MAIPSPKRRHCWLLNALIPGLVVSPVGAMEAVRPTQPRSMPVVGEGWLSQKPARREQTIPAEVQGWLDAAKLAAARGDAAEALRLQRQVLAWLEANPGSLDLFRASVQINMAVVLGQTGQWQEALALTQNAVAILRPLEKGQPEARRFLAIALNNLGTFFSEVGRQQETLLPTAEAVKIYRDLAQTNLSFQSDLASTLNNLGAHYSTLGRQQEAKQCTEEAIKIYRELIQTNPAYRGDLARSLNNAGVRYNDMGHQKMALASTEEAVKVYRDLVRSQPGYQGDLARALNNLGLFKKDLDQPDQAREAFEESLSIIRPLAAANAAFLEPLQRLMNSLEDFNRQDGLRTGERKLVATTDLSHLPKDNPHNSLRRSVVRLWPTFAGTTMGIGQLGTGFVVKRQGDRAWIATALHVVRSSDDWRPAIKVEAELYSGELPDGFVSPRLEVSTPPILTEGEAGEDLIILDVRGLPADVQPLPLSTAPPEGLLKVVGHPSEKPPWMVATFSVLKTTERQLVLDGQLLPGASGSPVLNGAGEVLGLVYQTTSYTSDDLSLVSAYRVQTIQAKLP